MTDSTLESATLESEQIKKSPLEAVESDEIVKTPVEPKLSAEAPPKAQRRSKLKAKDSREVCLV